MTLSAKTKEGNQVNNKAIVLSPQISNPCLSANQTVLLLFPLFSSSLACGPQERLSPFKSAWFEQPPSFFIEDPKSCVFSRKVSFSTLSMRSDPSRSDDPFQSLTCIISQTNLMRHCFDDGEKTLRWNRQSQCLFSCSAPQQFWTMLFRSW